jgi:hypothetical protein
MAAKQAPSKAQKNTAAPQKKPPSHESTSEKPPNHQSISEKTAKPPQKKPLQKKPPSHESTTEKTVGAQSSNPVQPPKPPMIKKMVEPINKRRLAWETTEEEGKTTIDAQHVHEFFSNLNIKQQRRELEKTKQLDLSKLGFFKLMSENSKKLMMPILASTSSEEDASMRKQTYVPSSLNGQEQAVAEMPTQEVVKLLGFMEEIRMPLGVALGHEEPPRDPSFEYRWPFQLGKPPKILPLKATRWSGWISKIFMKFTIKTP